MKHNRGFSLLEVTVAVSILIVGIVSVISLTNSSLSGAQLSKMRLISAGLAQEGIERVRDIREFNLDKSGWNNWYDSIINGDYNVQYNDTNLRPFSVAPLMFNPSTLLYQYDSGNDSLYYRRINLQKISSHQIDVLVEISWTAKGREHSLIAEDQLWNWR